MSSDSSCQPSLSSSMEWESIKQPCGRQNVSLIKWSESSSTSWPETVYPYIALSLIFWPVILCMAMTLALLSMWILKMSYFFTTFMVSLAFAMYQYTMIAFDAFAIFSIKTGSSLKRQVCYWLCYQERQWHRLVHKAQSYQEFLQIDIGPMSPKNHKANGPGSVMRRGKSTEHLADSHDLWNMTAFIKESDAAFTNTTTCHLCKSQRLTYASEPSTEPREHSSPVCQCTLPNSTFHSTEPSSCSSSSSPLVDPMVELELGSHTASLLVLTTARLRQARLEAMEFATEGRHSQSRHQPNHRRPAMECLQFLLSGVVKRNHLSLDTALAENAQQISDTGRYGLSDVTRQLIERYYQEIEACLQFLAETSTRSPPSILPTSILINDNQAAALQLDDISELTERIKHVRRLKHNMGQTALMLSGGGAVALYHGGLLHALLQADQYDAIKVIAGASGGSIVAGFCAIHPPDELVKHCAVPNVTTDYTGNGLPSGEMKRRNIRWFPSYWEFALHFVRKGRLMNGEEFLRTCIFHYGDWTFEEAFARTGKHVCISVSASGASHSTAQQLLLLNHISTPHVTIASAVAASCALPGLMEPRKLMAKRRDGTLEPFEAHGAEWVDGSLQADLPFEGVASMFSVSNYIVSQTNFHIAPFLKTNLRSHEESIFWRVYQSFQWDVCNRILTVSRLGLFPRIFAKFFEQKFHGNLTIIPRFTWLQLLGFKAISHPSAAEWMHYLTHGAKAGWPFMKAINDMIRLERTLDGSLHRLEQRLNDAVVARNQASFLQQFGRTDSPLVPLQTQHFKGNVESSMLPSDKTGELVEVVVSSSNTKIPVLALQRKNHDEDGDDCKEEEAFLRQRLREVEAENAALRLQLATILTHGASYSTTVPFHQHQAANATSSRLAISVHM